MSNKLYLNEQLVNNKKASNNVDQDDVAIVEQMINCEDDEGDIQDEEEDEKKLEGELEIQGK